MKTGSAIARVLGTYGLDILNVPSRFEDAMLQLLDPGSPEAAAIEEGCDARYLGMFIKASETGDADMLEKATENAVGYLCGVYGIEETVAREVSEAIGTEVAEHMKITVKEGDSVDNGQADPGVVTSPWNPIPQPTQSEDSFDGAFTGFEDIFPQEPPTGGAGYNNPQSGMTAPVAMGDGWSTPETTVPDAPMAPVTPQKKGHVPVAAMIAAIGLVGALGIGIGISMGSRSKDSEPVVQEQPVSSDEDSKSSDEETKPSDEPETTEQESADESESGDVDRAKQLALEKAQSYLEFMSFSHDGLVESLEYDGFNHEEAVYAADNCGADWNEQALNRAKSYLESLAFSESELLDQLEFEGFTTEQAKYGVANCGADWDEQAVRAAKEWHEYDPSMDRDKLIEMLEYDGFTSAQAEHGVDAVL